MNISAGEMQSVYYSSNQSSTETTRSFSTGQLNELIDNIAINLLHVTFSASVTLQTVFLIFGLLRLKIYKSYAVLKPENEKTSSRLLNFQIKSHWIISSIWILEAIGICVLNSRINLVALSAIARGLLIWPLLNYLFQFEENYKFSSPSKIRDSLSLKQFWGCCLILDLLTSVCQLYLWGDTNTGDKIIFGMSLIRSITLWGIFYLSSLKQEDRNYKNLKGTKVKEDEDDDWKYKSFEEKIETVTRQWSQMGSYMKINTKAKIGIVICFVTVVIERGLELYSEVITKELLDSISSVPTKNGTEPNNANTINPNTETIVKAVGMELKFRWDLLLTKTILHLVMHDVFRLTRDYAWDTLRAEIDTNNQIEMFRKIQHMSLRWHLDKRAGESLGVLRYGSFTFFEFLKYLFLNVIPDWLDVIMYIIYIAAVYPRLLNAVLFITTMSLIIVHVIIEQYRSGSIDAELKADDTKMNEAIDALVNFETVKYFTNEVFEEEKFTTALKDLKNTQMKTKWLDKWERTSQSVIRSVGSFLGSLLCYWMIFNDEGLTVGDYHMFGSNIYKFYWPFMSLTYLHSSFEMTMKEMEKVTSVLEEKIEIVDPINARDLIVAPGESEICFDDVHFSYVPERKILHGVTFTVPAGKTYALVGPTGCGKSTVLRLLFRFYDVSSGVITIGGQDIKTVSLHSLRNSIGVIPQDTVLFHQSLRKNILYGNLSTANPEEDVITAAKCACIHDRIQSFPDKYDTIVGSRGLKLSGGERQRVSIARAVLKNPPILLMDEATSALDSQTEKQIQNTLETICKYRTTLMIAHRLSTIINADKILVFDEGRIVESGSHKELLKQDGKYRKMWNEQISVKDN